MTVALTCPHNVIHIVLAPSASSWWLNIRCKARSWGFHKLASLRSLGQPKTQSASLPDPLTANVMLPTLVIEVQHQQKPTTWPTGDWNSGGGHPATISYNLSSLMPLPRISMSTYSNFSNDDERDEAFPAGVTSSDSMDAPPEKQAAVMAKKVANQAKFFLTRTKLLSSSKWSNLSLFAHKTIPLFERLIHKSDPFCFPLHNAGQELGATLTSSARQRQLFATNKLALGRAGLTNIYDRSLMYVLCDVGRRPNRQ